MSDLDEFPGWHVSTNQLKEQEERYNSERNYGILSSRTAFVYAIFSVQSRDRTDINRGMKLLNDLLQDPDEISRRDLVFYIALGHARLRRYEEAISFLDGLLSAEPANNQALELKSMVEEKQKNKDIKGAIIGGVAAGITAILAVVMAFAKR